MDLLQKFLPDLSLFNKLGKSHFKSLKLVFALTGLLCFASDLQGDIAKGKACGLNPISREDLQDAEQNWHTIIEVKPNKVGLERIQHNREAKGLPKLFMSSATPSEEYVQVKGQRELTESGVSKNLPSSVDNSQLPSFPPIGDQKELGSCVAWGTTYYQATHEYGLLHGLNNKTSLKNVFSPKWTYNNLNGGVDEGLNIFLTYQLFSQNGIVSIERLPYDGDYRTWDLNPQDWVAALSYRSTPGRLISGIGGASQNLQVIKQLLNNGHVLTFGTFIGSWQTKKIKKDSVSKDSHLGELAVAWMNGTNGGHCMTIVGYDDNVWVDVNGNGKVDAGERGAFLVANSWGTEWGNKGFVWIAYDAFLNKSKVANAPTRGRLGVAEAMDSYVVLAQPIAHQYSPKLIAQFSLSQTQRDQISVAVGISDTKSSSPSKVFNSYAVTNQGGQLKFDGTRSDIAQTATFALDLTDLLSTVPEMDKRFYLLVNDNKSGHPTTIESFSIIDPVNNKTMKTSKIPLSLDNVSKFISVDYRLKAQSSSSKNEDSVVLNITSPVEGQVIKGNTWLSANACDEEGIDRIEFYLDSELFTTDTTAPYYVLLPKGKLSRGEHNLTAVAYNIHGDSTSQSVSFVVE